MKQVRTSLPALALALALFPSVALADYDCRGRERDWPAAQAEFFNRASAGLRAALKPPPAGWMMSNASTRQPGAKYCLDFKNDPAVVAASVAYIIKPTADELRRVRAAQRAQRAEVEAIKTLPPDVQAKIDALDADAARLRREGREAERARDAELAKTRFAQVQDLGRQSYALRNGHEMAVQEQLRATYKKYEPEIQLNRDTVIPVTLEGNGVLRPLQPTLERTVIGSTAGTNQATDKLVRVAVVMDRPERVTAEQWALAKSLVDTAALNGMLSGKLPSLEESRAAIALQTEAMARLETQARELERSIENEGRREDEAAQIAKRQAAEAERAATKPATATAAPAAVAAPAPPPTPTAAAAPAANTAAAPASPAPQSAKPAPSPIDAANQAKDAVNKLKGLFGR